MKPGDQDYNMDTKGLEELVVAASRKLREKEYWLEKFSGNWVKSCFFYDYNRGERESEEIDRVFEHVTFEIPGEVFARLTEVTKGSDYALHVFLQAVLVVLLSKYNGSSDIIIGSPVFKQDTRGDYINHVLALRNQLHEGMTFRDVLFEVKETNVAAVENQNYPVEVLIRDLNLPYPTNLFPLFDVAILLKNIHDSTYVNKIGINMVISFEKFAEKINGIWQYNSSRYERNTVEHIVRGFSALLQEVLINIAIPISALDILSEDEKKGLLYDFNNTHKEVPGEKTLPQLFADQVEKSPAAEALIVNRDIEDIFADLISDKLNESMESRYAGCCFKKNRFIFKYGTSRFLEEIFPDEEEIEELILLQTERQNFIVVNRPLLLLLEYFDGLSNLQSILIGLATEKWQFLVYDLFENYEPAGFLPLKKGKYVVQQKLSSLIMLVKGLYKANLVSLSDIKTGANPLEIKPGYKKDKSSESKGIENESKIRRSDIAGCAKSESLRKREPVLLLGDTVGTASTGILYLGAFLRRHGIEAYCLLNQLERRNSFLKEYIESLLLKICPRVVGISLKWFPHIARVLRICEIIKEYDSSIKVVVGGNTASYYKEYIIKYQWIDYLVMGDGEVPLLKICCGEKDIPNCLYKKENEVLATALDYVQDESNSGDIFLSHLDEMLISPVDLYLTGSFYINTGKGCLQNCFYCAGCREVQELTFGRLKPFLRSVDTVRKDIIAVKNYVSTFMFDFDLPFYDSIDYYKNIWQGIDLSRHFCEFYFWKLPTEEFIAVVANTFKYVYLNIDLCSLSRKHRRKLSSLGVVKPQPTDEELFSFFDQCSIYDNVAVKINQIAGLPYFSRQDIEDSSTTIFRITENYPCFVGLDWGRLHAQPGAPIVEDSEKYGMYSYAKNFRDYLHYSELNLKELLYPSLETIHYPYIYFKEEELNSGISKYYVDTDNIVEQHKERLRKNLILCTRKTYRELDKDANLFARRLKNRGMKPGEIVGVLVKSSTEMAAAILGILQAGGAFLPIDTAYPDARIAYILENSDVEILITDRPQSFSSRSLEIVDVNDGALSFEKNCDPRPVINPDDIAYVIYTSGTTGKPKGVPVAHRSVVNMLTCRKAEYKIAPGDTALQLFSYAFDGFVTSFFTPLISGARIVLLNEEERADIVRLKAAIVGYRVTHFISVPVLYCFIIESLDKKSLSRLKIVTLAGDKLPALLPRLTRQKSENIEIAHEYGVTEASVLSTLYRHQEKDDRITIGAPIWNTRLYILDKQGNLQLMGVPGELCISGAGIARGYLNNPEQTWEKFTADPFSKKEILYRTGDLARWLPEGNVEFLGRIDTQVKIRGFRIELAEIENKILQHEAVKETVVLVKENSAVRGTDDAYNSKSLCAYFIPGRNISVLELRNFLQQELPEFMVPAYIVKLVEFPITPNGKIDYRALPDPAVVDSESGIEYAPPRNDIEKKLAAVWKDVLGRDEVGINDNYFLIGGDSIKTIQIASRMNEEGYKLEMKDIFRNPSIAELAPLVIKNEQTADQAAVKGSVPLTPIQHWFFENKKIDKEHFNQAVLFHSREILEKDAVREIFTALQEHHDALRMTFKEESGRVLQFNHGLDFPISLQVFDYRGETDTDLLENAVNRIQASIDLKNGPLMKLALFHLDDGDRLLIVIHHLIIDGVSWRILFDDIGSIFRQYKSGSSFTLPIKTDSFKSWAEKLNEYADSQVFLKEKDYWHKLAAAEIPRISLDSTCEEDFVEDEESLFFRLSEDVTKLLLTKVNFVFNTEINDILLTGLGLAMKKTFGSNPLLIALEGHGREEVLDNVDISRTIGWFTSLYPVLLDMSYEKELARQIKEVKESLHNVPNKGIGYGILRYLTAAENKKDTKFKGEPQISFNYLGQFDEDIRQTPFRIAKESAGIMRSFKGLRDFELEVSGVIVDKKLEVSVRYNKKHFKTGTIEKLRDNFAVELDRVISFCSSLKDREITPGDLTYKKLSIDFLERLNREYAISDIYMLSSMQEGILFHSLYDDSSYMYLEQISYRLQGMLDLVIIEKSLNDLFMRHDILRTVFIYEGCERPLQVVLNERRVDFFYEDLRPMNSGQAKEEYLKQIKEKDRSKTFDLSHDVLMRVTVLQLHDSEYEFIWTHHHILMDGWCSGIIISELLEIYNSYLQQRTPQLPSVKPYRDYIKWLGDRDFNEGRSYWKDYLDGYNETSGIPKVREPGMDEEICKNAEFDFILNNYKTDSLSKLAMASQVTFNSIVHTIWGILLGRYTGRHDVVFGEVVTGRPSEIIGVETMIGLFTNTVPVRVTYNDGMKFSDLLYAVQQKSVDSRPYHYFQLAEIQAASALKQDLFDHILEFSNYPVSEQLKEVLKGNELNSRGIKLAITNVEIRNQNNYRFDLLVSLNKQLKIKFRCDKNIYDQGFIKKIATHFEEIVDQVLEDNNIKLEEITISHDLLVAGSESRLHDQGDFCL